MLDERNVYLYDTYKKVYAEILHSWDLLNARAQVLKYLSTTPPPHVGVEFCSECQHCSKPVRGASCNSCKKLILQCAICHLSVRDIFLFVCRFIELLPSMWSRWPHRPHDDLVRDRDCLSHRLWLLLSYGNCRSSRFLEDYR
uniref:Uncharacterized protein n=1 Tax=Timema douglasi TaxID=61478 RepID=A0A7R8VAC7_TIMDO|nr:unnamed protein product [Timema douglasi]